MDHVSSNGASWNYFFLFYTVKKLRAEMNSARKKKRNSRIKLIKNQWQK